MTRITRRSQDNQEEPGGARITRRSQDNQEEPGWPMTALLRLPHVFVSYMSTYEQKHCVLT